MLNARIAKHMQYPPNQHNWATDSVCCAVKECGRSRVQNTARPADCTTHVHTTHNHTTPSHTAPLSLSLPLPLLFYHISNAYNNPLCLFPSVSLSLPLSLSFSLS